MSAWRLFILLGIGFSMVTVLFTETTLLSSEPMSLWRILGSTPTHRDGTLIIDGKKVEFVGVVDPEDAEEDEHAVEARYDSDDEDSLANFASHFEARMTEPFQDMNPAEVIQHFIEEIGNNSDLEKKRDLFIGLRYKLLDPRTLEEAQRALSAFLQSGEDTETGIGLQLQMGGGVTTSPTMRMFALYLLGVIDAEEGATYGAEVLKTNDSPDEWAIALKNILRRGTPEDKQLAAKAVDTMLQTPEWLQNPSPGFLESFDVLVSLGKTDSVANLGELHVSGIEEIQYAAYTALHNLAEKTPADTLRELNATPQILQEAPLLRADLFAKGDIRRRSDRAQVKHYLLRDDITVEELEKFVAIYPNLNSFSGANLLNDYSQDESTEERDYERYRDVVAQWMAEPRFKNLIPYLEQLDKKLLDDESWMMNE